MNKILMTFFTVLLLASCGKKSSSSSNNNFNGLNNTGTLTQNSVVVVFGTDQYTDVCYPASNNFQAISCDLNYVYAIDEYCRLGGSCRENSCMIMHYTYTNNNNGFGTPYVNYENANYNCPVQRTLQNPPAAIRPDFNQGDYRSPFAIHDFETN